MRIAQRIQLGLVAVTVITTAACAAPRTPTPARSAQAPAGVATTAPRAPVGEGGPHLDLPDAPPISLHLPGLDATLDLKTCTFEASITDEAVGFGQDSFVVQHPELLDPVIDQLRDATAVDVTGYASSEGDDAYNLSLSQQRARAVADVLAARLPNVQFSVVGLGEADPLVPDERSEADRSANRRVVVRAPVRSRECR